MDSSASAPSEQPHDEASGGEQQRNKRKRKIKGRSGRRRNAKLKAIQEAEERIWKGDTTSMTSVATLLPTDRDKIWPGVLERRKEGLTSADEAALVGQLGYLPGNAVSVAARAQQVPSLPLEKDVPIVLKLYPLAIRDVYAGGKSDGRKFKGRRRGPSPSPSLGGEDEADTDEKNEAKEEEEEEGKDDEVLLEPFPTLYWLTHPMLRTLTSKLELGTTDSVRVMEERLQSDPQALDSMLRAHHAYGQDRWESLTEADLELVEARKWREALDERRGVAGIKKHKAIKCLHAHLAHYLSGGRGSDDNIVGKWVMESITKLLLEHTKSGGETEE